MEIDSKKIIIQTLKRAQALVKFKKNWIKDNFAATEEDIPTGAFSPSATKFCSVGALRRASTNTYAEVVRPYLVFAVQLMSEGECKSISLFNDSPERTHEEIMEMFEIAIAWAEAEDLEF